MQQQATSSPSAVRLGALALAVAYVAAVAAIGGFVRPLNRGLLIGVALLPAVVALGFGIPRVIRSQPRGILAVFHLLVYPALAAIVLGLPGVYLALRIAELVDA